MYSEVNLAPEIIEELNEAFNLLNTGNKDFLDHRELKVVMASRLDDRNSQNEIRRLFDLLDVDKTGFITLENMKKVANDIQEMISEEDLAEIIEEADQDKDGVLNFEDFYKVMSIRDTLYYE